MQEILKPFGPKDVNIAFVVKADYGLTGPIIQKLDNYNQNKYYDCNREYIIAWESPLSEHDAAWEHLDDECGRIFQFRDWHSPIHSFIANMILKGMIPGKDLSLAMYSTDARNRLLNLYVQMKAQGINAQNPKDISQFLAHSPHELYNPFTQQPFQYDADNKLLYFMTPGNADYPSYKSGVVLN